MLPYFPAQKCSFLMKSFLKVVGLLHCNFILTCEACVLQSLSSEIQDICLKIFLRFAPWCNDHSLNSTWFKEVCILLPSAESHRKITLPLRCVTSVDCSLIDNQLCWGLKLNWCFLSKALKNCNDMDSFWFWLIHTFMQLESDNYCTISHKDKICSNDLKTGFDAANDGRRLLLDLC